MIRGDDLGEVFGLGAVGFVAAGADNSGVQFGWLHGGGIVSMSGLGSVARFARDDDVAALLFLIDHVDVAAFAHLMTGMGDGAGGGLGDGRAAIVSVLAKTLGDDDGAQGDERDQCDRHDGGEADEVFKVLEQGVLSAPYSRRGRRAKKRNTLG